MYENNNSIEIKNIFKSFGENDVLRGISFDVKKNTIHGLIGPNGAGKTTLLNTIANLNVPDKGEIFIDGKSVINDPDSNINLGYVPAEAKFPAHMKVEKYIAMVSYLRNIPQEKVEKNLLSMGLSEFQDKKCSELSTG